MNFMERIAKEKNYPFLTAEQIDNGKNGTGYYDGLMDLSLTETHQFIDEFKRNGLVIPIKDNKNLVVFKRYGDPNNDVVVTNNSRDFNFMFGSGLSYFEQKGILDYLHGKKTPESEFDSFFRLTYIWSNWVEEEVNKTNDFLKKSGFCE